MRQIVLPAFEDSWLVLRYAAVGFFAMALNIGLLYVFTDIMGFWYLLAAITAFVVTFFVAFMLQKHWTFKDGSAAYIRQGALYLTVGLSVLLLDAVCLYVAVDLFGFWYLGAQIVIMGVLALVSFLANRHITFRHVAEADHV